MRSLTAEPAVATEQVSGLVERVTYHNPENGFAVLRVKVRGRRELVTVVGHCAVISAGEHVQAGGSWVTDRTHGLQLKAVHLTATPPTGVEGIRRYLGSGMVRGIGPVYAEKLVAAFGEAVLDVIEAEPARLKEVSGIGEKRAAAIVAAWAEQKAVREIMLFLHGHGVSTARAVRIFKTYGDAAVARITEDPYRLARDIRGIGFRSADKIAASLGIEKTAMVRARAGVAFALAEKMDQGHCGLPEDELLPLAAELLEIPEAIVGEALSLELEDGRVVADTLNGRRCVFLAGLYRAERAIAARLQVLAAGLLPWPAIEAERAIPWAEEASGIQLAEGQREAVALALRSKVLVITGGPGVGKTTLVNTILRIFRTKGVEVALAAPTGRAAKRLQEATGLEAKTLHRLLEADPAKGGFKRKEDNPLDGDLLVVDETSMVDVPLMHALLKAVPDEAALILVGDVDQLPSVGPGQVLADVIESGAIPVVRLTEVFRQAAQSRIVTNAHRINRGLMPEPGDDPTSDFHIVRFAEPEEGAAKLLQVVAERIPARFGLDPVRDVQVLCPMNRGRLGARTLNLDLRRVLNPPQGPVLERFGWAFAAGDKVMQAENDYDKEVFNGDLGLVVRVEPEAGEVVVRFDTREVAYLAGELDALVPAFATTVHKAQGSEYPAVVIPVSTQHYPMLARNLLYTAVTRGRRLVVLVAQPRAVAIAVRGRGGRRWSKLREWLQAGNA